MNAVEQAELVAAVYERRARVSDQWQARQTDPVVDFLPRPEPYLALKVVAGALLVAALCLSIGFLATVLMPRNEGFSPVEPPILRKDVG